MSRRYRVPPCRMPIECPAPVCPINCINSDVFNTNNQLSDYWTLNPTTINEFRIGFMGEYDTMAPHGAGASAAAMKRITWRFRS